MMKVSFSEDETKLIIEIDIQDPPVLSSTGKTLVIASSHGNIALPDVLVEGRPLTVGVNAYIKA